LQKLEDKAEVKADPIERDDEISITLEKTLESLQLAIDHPGSASRLVKEIKPSLQEWADNSPDIEEQKLVPTTTSDEWYEILDKVGDIILESPAAAEKGFWAIANPVASWKESTKGKSREQSISRPSTPAPRTPGGKGYIFEADDPATYESPKGKRKAETAPPERKAPVKR